MKRMKPFVWILPAIGVMCAIGVFTLSGKRNVVAETVAEPGNEIVVTIGAADRSALALGDTLRKQYKFKEAIAVYQKVLDTQGIPVVVKAEAEYDIGLSYTWLGEYDPANAVFNRMLDVYKDDPNAVGYAQFCIAWVEIQKGKYQDAIARLESSVAKGNITDRELAARTQYLIGRTYLMFLDDPVNAKTAFLKVLSKYPETETARHPYIAGLNG